MVIGPPSYEMNTYAHAWYYRTLLNYRTRVLRAGLHVSNVQVEWGDQEMYDAS